MPKKYLISPAPCFVKDEASVKFHVKSDDYFGTIATVLNLIEQQIKKDASSNAGALDSVLNNLKKDLMFLQKNYKIKERHQISPKAKNKNKIPNGKLKSQ